MWQKRSTYSAPLRYFAVVSGGFVVDFLTYSAIVASRGSIYWGNAAGFLLGAAFNVVLIRRYVFTNSRHSLPKDFLLTIAANGLMLLLGMGMLWFLVEHWSMNPYLAKLFANAVTFALNYVTRITFFTRA